MAQVSDGITRGASETHQVQDACPSEPTRKVPTQTLGHIREYGTQYEWHLDPMNAPSRDVTETLDRIARTMSNEEGPRATQDIRDIKPTPLCDFCCHIFTHLKPSQPREDAPNYVGGLWTSDRKTQSNAQFERSATEFTCSFCRCRWNQLELKERESPAKDIGEDDIALHYSTLPLHLKFKYPFAELPKTLLLASCRDTEVILLTSVSESCNSPTSWALANFWLQRCVNGHEKCQRLAQTDQKLPTRLVDLGPEALTVRPRLCRSVDLPHGSRYATLSHRWGGTIMPTLTLATVQTWTDGIPVSILSLTFKEAMEATKRLGLRYIWIDSICIIQDSEEDWTQESAAMGSIYRNSYCSISAAAGQSIANRGLFVQRDPRDIYPCVAKSQHALWKGGADTDAGADYDAWYCFPRDMFEQNVTDSPLFARGWVVQEHILAPRVLHFAKRQLFWECAQLQACEALPAGMLDTGKTRQKKLSIDVASLEIQSTYTNSPYRKVAERQFLWNEVVERFSTTTLTFPDKDKLAAVSGLAKAVGVKCEYLSGLWRDHLAVHLLWGRHAGSAILERPRKYQAPSWSWASVNGRIFTTRVWPLKGYEVIASVLSAHVELLSTDPTGPVKAGCLRLRGCLAPVAVRKWPPRRGYVEIWNYDVREEPERDDRMQCHPDIDFERDEERFYMFLVTLRSYQESLGGYGAGDGILLQPTGKGKGEFYRRGRFMCGPYQKRADMRPFLDLFRTSATTLGPEHYVCKSDCVEATYGFPMYEISII